MKYAEIICALILAISLLFVFIKQCFTEKRVYKYRLFSCFAVIVLLVLLLAFNRQIEENEKFVIARDILIVLSYVVIGLSLLINIDMSISRTSLEVEFIKSLEVDKIFVLLDKKERIKQISTSFTRFAGIEKQDAIGHKFFDFLQDNFILISLNDVEMKISRVKEYFKDYQATVKEGTKEKREFVLSTRDGSDTFVLNMNDVAIFTASKYTGHLLIGDRVDGDNLLSAQRELVDRNTELLNIKSRFTSFLSITDENVFFYNLDESYVWGNDALVRTLNLNGNSVGRSEFEHYIHKDDLAFYNKTIASLTSQSPSYDIKYRFKTGQNYQFVHEKGKRIFNKTDSDEIVGTIEVVNDKHYERSNMPSLDSIKDEAEMLSDIEQCYRSGRAFEVCMFRLTNLPEINNAHGRSIGNMVLGEFVKAIEEKFVNDGFIYRISGLEFVFVITDGRRMTILQQLLEKGVLTNTTMNYGSLSIDIEANFGIAFYNDAANAKEIVKAVYRALNTASLPQVEVNYMFYRDIR